MDAEATPHDPGAAETKRCRNCAENKPAAAFYINRASRDGLDRVCKPCRKALYGEKQKTRCRTYSERMKRSVKDRQRYQADDEFRARQQQKVRAWRERMNGSTPPSPNYRNAE